MMIQLTNHRGKKIWFNINHITVICADDDSRYTAVYTTDCTDSTYWLVEETPTSVVGLIEQERNADHVHG